MNDLLDVNIKHNESLQEKLKDMNTQFMKINNENRDIKEENLNMRI